MKALHQLRGFQFIIKSRKKRIIHLNKPFLIMKKHFQKLAIVLIAGLLFSVTTTFAESISYNDSWGKQGYSVTSQKSTGVEINFSIINFSLSQGIINGESMDILGLPGVLLPNNEGAPNLPGNGRYLAIPEGAMATLNVVSFQTETFKDVELSPAPRIPLDTEDGPLDFAKDMKIYQKDAFYPTDPFQLSEITQIRGVDAVMLGITPFQYNPVTKELIVYRDIKIEIAFEGGTNHFGEDHLRSRYWDPLMNDMFLNYASLPKINYNKNNGAKDTGCEYLIIIPTDDIFQQWADSIKEFRTLQGIMTDVVTLDDVGGNTPSILENYVDGIYASWDIVPSAILLLGDYGTNPANSITSPIYDNYCVSDNILADVSGNSMPDIVFARMTAQNAAHLETVITKFLDYERTPPTSADFYNNPITALGFQTERWFQICSESVAGFWENELGKSPVRINKTYIGNPNSDPWSTATNTSTVLDVFGPNGLGYIPATPGEVNCTWNGSGQDVINGINSGAFILQHRDHGGETGWGEPDFQSSDINSLDNTDLTFIWSINCLTGKYNISGECFAEKFHRHTSGGQNSGALGIIAASEVSYSFVNDTYVWGAYDNQWPEFLPDYGTTPDSRDILPAFGNAAGKYFLEQSSWPYNTNNKEVTYNLFHMHGDAFSMVYSEIPQNLAVSHNPILYAGVTSFDVSANEGAFIALTVNGEIIGTAEATGAPVSISIPGQIPPDQVIVTITKQNFYRYTFIVDVIPPTGPYVVKDGYSINDIVGGNGDGMMDYGETNLLSVTVKNVGVVQADNVVVTISSTDGFITITDDTENYGDILAGETALVDDGFAYDVADDIPDMHNVTFEISATDGSDTWLSYISITGHAPILEVGTMTIDDSQGGNGNGRLDPGEDADIIIETFNTGSSNAIDILGTLSITNSFVTVNNSTYDLDDLGGGSMDEAVFSISVNAGAPLGTAITIEYDVVSGQYSAQESFGASIGLILEDWESGGMEQYDWVTGGNGNWSVVNNEAYEGVYSAQSSDISDNQSNYVQLEYDVFGDDVISFWMMVSSEANWDYLRFYIDGNEQASWSGSVGWQEVEFSVTGGTHTFKWEYDKDGSVSNGSDCAWVDFIILPAPEIVALNAIFITDNTTICEGETVNFVDASTGSPISWNWTFEGGSPGTSTEQNPAVTYASEGTFDVSLEVSDGTETVSSTIENYISVNTAPDSPDTPVGETEVCSNYGLTYDYTIASVANADSYEWEIAPAEAGNISGTGLTGSVLWTENWAGTASIQVKAMNDCGDSELSGAFDVDASLCMLNADFAANETEVCTDESVTFSDLTYGAPTTWSWTFEGGTPATSNEENPTVTYSSVGTYDVTLEVSDGTNTNSITKTDYISVSIAPESPATPAGEAEACSNIYLAYEYTISSVANADSYEWEITPADAGNISGTGLTGTVTWTADWTGTASVQAKAINDCGDSGLSGAFDVEVSICTGIADNINEDNLNVYPNPNSGSFTFELNGFNNEVVVTVHNALGKIVYRSDKLKVNGNYSKTIDLDVNDGVYHMHIKGDDMMINKKVIIQK